MLLHRIFQKHKKFPSEIRRLPPGERAFIYASELLVIEEEKREMRRQNLGQAQPKGRIVNRRLAGR